MKNFLIQQRMWLWPIVLMLLITPFTPTLDLAITRYFYQGNGEFSRSGLFHFMYDYGVVPAQIIAGGATLLLFFSLFTKKLQPTRRIALVLALSLTIGSGVICHFILKDHWGRPRPKQVVEFGGIQPFRPYYEPNLFHQPQPSKSFPCGHCTMGFYFFSVALIGRKLNNRSLYRAGLLFALFLGGLLSLTRIAQGGHFLSDTLMSALIMWLTSYFCVEWIMKDTHERID